MVLFGPLVTLVKQKWYRSLLDRLTVMAQYCRTLLAYEDMFTWGAQDKEFFELRRAINTAAELFAELYQEYLAESKNASPTAKEALDDVVDAAFHVDGQYIIPNTPALHKLYCLKYEQLKHCWAQALWFGTNSEREEIENRMCWLIDAFQKVGQDSSMYLYSLNLNLPCPQVSTLQELLEYHIPEFPSDFKWDQ